MISDRLMALNPKDLDIIDEGHLHIGHEGAKKGGISSDCYIGSI